MEQNENLLPLLPQGITGFGSGCDDAAPWISAEEFKRLAYLIAQNNQMTVSCTDLDLTGKNFYWVACQKHGKLLFLLLNSRYPYLAFADQIKFFSIHFVDPLRNFMAPPGVELFPLDLNLLCHRWQGYADKLGVAELQQIKYWKSLTTGEIIFNFWD